jgi:peptidyl-prolyl cis-trans isomerase SurA
MFQTRGLEFGKLEFSICLGFRYSDLEFVSFGINLKMISQTNNIANKGQTIWTRVICSLSFICHFCFGICCYSFAQDKIVAVVNNEIITQRDTDDFANFMRMELEGEYQGEELEKKIQDMRQDLLDKLIEDRLVLQAAKKEHLSVDPAKVKARIDEIRSHYPTDGQFQEALIRQGLAQADLEAKIKEQLLMYNIIELKVRSSITVKPSEVTDFFNSHLAEFQSLEQRQVQALKLADGANAKALHRGLIAGESPEVLSKEYSFESENIELSQSKEFRKEIIDAVFKLNIGEFSDPIKVEAAFYIFKLEKIIPPRQLELSEVQGNIHNYLFNTKMQLALAKWLDGLRQHSYIKIPGDASS